MHDLKIFSNVSCAHAARLLAVTGLLMLGACAQTSTPPAPTYTDEQVQQSQAALQAVRESYDNGEYGDVITRVLRDAALQDAPTDIRVDAFKLQAFSLCMQDYITLCRERFQMILALQPDFDLSAQERGHPQWGPVFEQVKPTEQAK